MSPEVMRLEALKLAVGQRGNPNVIQEAEKFLEFLRGPEGETIAMVTDSLSYVKKGKAK